MTAQHWPVVIIGAGPAGLALGRELRARGIRFQILEKNEVGNSWRHMPQQLKLVSPWKWSFLNATSRNHFAPNAQLTRSDFEQYLVEFAGEHQLPVTPDCEVSAVERAGENFCVRTSRGDFTAHVVVNATGYFSNPIVPQIEGASDTTIPRIHFADYVDTQDIVSRIGRGGSVLLVGKRLSAGQLALELFDAGLRVSISHRSPIRFGADDWLWPLVYRTFAHIEAVRLCFGPGRPLDVRMPGGRARKLIETGAIKCFSAIKRFAGNSVAFENGETLSPGIVIYTTGFAPTQNFLQPLMLGICPETGVPLTHHMESVSVPNLFFLGFDMLRNFQSRFLRGIRKDAIVLADIIAARAVRFPQNVPNELCSR